MRIQRVRYREGQRLRAADLNDEQAYRLAWRRGHHISHHGWGIVTGLALAVARNRVRIQPGFAVDGYGRELVVPEALAIPPSAFDKLGTESLRVWLVYHRKPKTPAGRGRWQCGPGQHSRWHEEARVCLTVAGDTDIDPRLPPGIPDADLEPDPHQALTGEPAKRWPVYLGQVMRQGDGYRLDLANRPYATLVGEVVVAPSGRAQMQVGAEEAGDRKRFVVSLPDEEGRFAEHLAIDREGDATIRGDTTVDDGNLVIAEAEARQVPLVASDLARLCGRQQGQMAEDQSWGIAFEALDAPPEEAAPWQIYRTTKASDDGPINQLLFEVGHPGDESDPTRYGLSVGYADVEGAFIPCLTVRADCTVVVHGDLAAKAQVLQGPIEPDPSDPRFAAAVLDAWGRGVSGSAATVDGIYAGDLSIRFEGFGEGGVFAGNTLSYTVVIRNTGRGSITTMEAHESVAINDTVARQVAIASGVTVASGMAEEVDRTFEVPSSASGEVRVGVMALGLGPAGTPVSASGEFTVTIQGPIE